MCIQVNRRGPRTEPCGTPHCRTDEVDSWPTNTDWVRQLKYEINQSRTVPEQPKVLRKLVIRMLWSVVLKAAYKSSSDKIETQTLSEAWSRSFPTRNKARRFQCCDTFSRQIGTALEGCETVNAAKTVSGQYSPVPLARMANLKQAGRFQAVGI